MAETNYILGKGELELRDALEKLSQGERATFATACAVRLAPSYRWFIDNSGRGDRNQFDEALETAWSISTGFHLDSTELAALCSSLETHVPDDQDTDWLLMSAIAQNALAAVIYALSAHSDETIYGVWAARQPLDLADFLVQSKLPVATIDSPDAPETDFVITATANTLRAVTAGDSLASIRRDAEADGERFMQFLPATIDSW